MNIKTRIVRLEERTTKSNDGFCNCPSVSRFELYRSDLSIDSDSNEPKPMGELVPDVCVKCRRPINKDVIILQFCDRTTKDRFPNEWSKNNEH